MQRDKNIVWTDKNDYLNRIIQAAKLYDNNLLNKNMLIIYKMHPNQYFYIEVLFEAKHFLHLTGVTTLNGILSIDFFERCLNRSLSVNDFTINDNWTTTKKMNVIIPLMSIFKNSRTVGNFKPTGSNALLYTDKLVGRESGCMGFVLDDDINYYVPNTVLQEDIRDAIDKSNQLMGIYMKIKEEERYNRLCYVSKPIDSEKVRWNKEIEIKIVDKENLKIECNQPTNKPKEDKKHKNKKKSKKTTT